MSSLSKISYRSMNAELALSKRKWPSVFRPVAGRPTGVLSVVTTSWDDGHPLDFRLAELLARYQLPATFYVPLRNQERPVLSGPEIRRLSELGCEIGSHTVSHRVLTSLSRREILEELTDSKSALEDTIGKEVRCVCYPKGEFNVLVCRACREAGYLLGRTTVAFRTDSTFEPTAAPVTVQICPRTFGGHVKHAIKDGNLLGLLRWYQESRCASDFMSLIGHFYSDLANRGGVLHIWGHSWEIDAMQLWKPLEQVFQMISGNQNVQYVRNSELVCTAAAGLSAG